MKKIAFAVVVFLVGCTPSTKDVRNHYALPTELNDCTFHYLRDDGGSGITVVRCPNSSTSAKTGGKTPRTTIVIDGVEYEKVEK